MYETCDYRLGKYKRGEIVSIAITEYHGLEMSVIKYKNRWLVMRDINVCGRGRNNNTLLLRIPGGFTESTYNDVVFLGVV